MNLRTKMVSKKEALILSILVIGGIGAASMVSDTGGGGAREGRAGGILGTPTGQAAGPTIYQFAAQPAVTFPAAPTFDIGKMMAPIPVKKDPVKEYYKARKGAGYMPRPWEVRKILSRGRISKTSPATGIQPYVYTGGKVALGAATPAPWAVKKDVPKATYMPAARLPAAIGISTALSYAKNRGAQGVSAPPKKEVK